MRVFVKLAIAAAFIAAAVGIAIYLDKSLLKLNDIAISEVSEGARDWLFQDIKKSLNKQTQAMLGKYIWEVDLEELMRLAESDKRIESVQIKRSLPNKIDVKILPHEPMAIYWANRSEIYPVARDGTLMPKIKSTDYFDAPVLRGRTFFEDKEVRKKAMIILEATEDLKALNSKKISEIHFDKQHGFSLVLSPEGESLKLGNEDFIKRLAMAEKVLNYLNSQGMKGRVIDVRFSKKVVVRLRNAP